MYKISGIFKGLRQNNVPIYLKRLMILFKCVFFLLFMAPVSDCVSQTPIKIYTHVLFFINIFYVLGLVVYLYWPYLDMCNHICWSCLFHCKYAKSCYIILECRLYNVKQQTTRKQKMLNFILPVISNNVHVQGLLYVCDVKCAGLCILSL